MADLVERLRHWLHIFNAKDLDDTLAAAADEIERLRSELDTLQHTVVSQIDEWEEANGVLADKRLAEIERLRATVEWQHRALQINSEDIERLTRERDAALDALAKSVERINDFVTEIKLWENDSD